jgi:hypothetical protein
LNWLRPSLIRCLWSKGPRFAVTGEVWRIICRMGFCTVHNVLHSGDMLPENFNWHSHTWNARLPFPEEWYNSITKTPNRFQIEQVSQQVSMLFP